MREKDLQPEEYRYLAGQVLQICEKEKTMCILHSFPEIAKELGAANLHLPMPLLRSMSEADKKSFRVLGASCHSLEEALEAEKRGCTYITAGHVFETDCKKGAAPRGVDFLKEICSSVTIPVYGIGGICAQNLPLVMEAGAAGACVMSGLMCCQNPGEYLKEMCRKEERRLEE